MPIDRTAINGIIQAFLSGYEIQARNAAAQEAERVRQDEKATREKERKEDAKREDEKFKATMKFNEAQFKARQAEANRDYALKGIDFTSKYDVPLPGYEVANKNPLQMGPSYELPSEPGQQIPMSLAPTPINLFEPAQESFEIAPGQYGMRTTYAGIDPNANLPAYTSPDPISAGIQQATVQDLMDRKKQERAISMEQLKHDYDLELHAADDKAAMERLREEYRLRGLLEDKTRKNKLQEFFSEAIPPEKLELFPDENGVVPTVGTTWGEIAGRRPGIKMSTAQTIDDSNLSQMQFLLNDAARMLDDLGWEKYYLGKSIPGGIEELRRRFGFEEAQKILDISARVEAITTILGKEYFGASFTSGEKQRLESFAPSGARWQNTADAKSRFKSFWYELKTSQEGLRTAARGRTIAPTGGVGSSIFDDFFGAPK